MFDNTKVEQLALESWYMATIMTYLTNILAEECCMDEVYMIDLLAKHVKKPLVMCIMNLLKMKRNNYQPT